MLVAFAIWQILVMLRDGFETRRSMLVGLLIALASLTKLSGLAMGLTVAVSSIYIAMRDRDRRGFIILAASMAALWLLIAGWWYLRNLNLYGELFGANALIENFGGRSASLSQVVSDEFQGLRNSFWGLFGWFSIFTGPLHYLAMDLLSLLAAVGLAVYLFFNRRDRVKTSAVLLLSILVAFAGAALLWYTLRTTASQGRLLFAVICAISVLMAMGLSAWRIPPLLLIAPMFVFSVAAPFAYIIPQYDHPPRVTALPDTATVDYARWDDITLVGHELPAPQRWSAGDEIPLTLYWQPLAQSADCRRSSSPCSTPRARP